ncbi:UNVERIFIED_CONTAM: hypothetical protein K2H54_030463 [Gekko kuhli]
MENDRLVGHGSSLGQRHRRFPLKVSVALKKSCRRDLTQQETLSRCGKKPGKRFHSRMSEKLSPFCSRCDGSEPAFLELVDCFFYRNEQKIGHIMALLRSSVVMN